METSPPHRKPRLTAAATGLDSLPPEILKNIVSSLPLRDAVGTSACLPSPAPGAASGRPPPPSISSGATVGSDSPAIVDSVLARYSCHVRSFSFHLPEVSFSLADGWVPLLAGKGVQELSLHFRQDRGVEPHFMHAVIFFCRELTSLSLTDCDLSASPSGLEGFPNLTRLCLWGVGFPENGVRGLEALIAESPLLEVLLLDKLWIPEDYDDEYDEWVIEAPNLRRLTIFSEYDYGWQIKELPSIEEVEIKTDSYTSSRAFVKLLTGLARARKLELEMLIWFAHGQEAEVGVDLLNAQWTDGLFANLKSVRMNDATHQSNEMRFIEFVLSKARRLQAFHVCVYGTSPDSYEEELVEITKY